MSGMEINTCVHSILKRDVSFKETIARLIRKAEKEKKETKTSYVVNYKGYKYIVKIEVEPKNNRYFRPHEEIIYHLDPPEGDD